MLPEVDRLSSASALSDQYRRNLNGLRHDCGLRCVAGGVVIVVKVVGREFGSGSSFKNDVEQFGQGTYNSIIHAATQIGVSG
jgi:hypothetical protein